MTADTQAPAPAPAPTADMVLVRRSVLEPFASVVDAKSFRHLQPEQRLYVETHAEHVVCEGLRARDFIAARDALAASPTPSLAPSDAQAALGHLYGIASSIASVGPDIASDIRHHADTIMWAMTSPSPARVGAKELVWRSILDETFIAETPLGIYRIEDDGGSLTEDRFRLFLAPNLNKAQKHATIAAAKSAAQADFAARIQSCVTPLAGEAGAVEADLTSKIACEIMSLDWARGGNDDEQADRYGALQEAIEPIVCACAALSLTPPKAETETASGEALYLIRKGALFYRPNSQGYTASTIEAGRYTLAEAKAITHPNGPDGPRDGMDYIPAPAPADTASEHTLTRSEALDALAADYGETMHAETASERERLVEALQAALAGGPFWPTKARAALSTESSR